MPAKISEEKRRTLIERMIVDGNVSKIAHDEEVSEQTVRNIWSEAKAGVYPEYTSFIPAVEALRRLSEDMKKSGITVAQAATGLTIFKALRELGIEPNRLPSIVRMLRSVDGDIPPPAFGKAVEQLAELQAQTGLNFQQLVTQIVTKRSELESLQTKVKTAIEELASTQSKITEAKEELNRTLKQNSVTLESLKQYLETKRVLSSAGMSLADLDEVAKFCKAARSEGFLEASKELATLQSKTGRNFKGILEEYKKSHDAVEKLREERDRLTSENNALIQRVADLKREEAEQLVKNGTTKAQLDQYTSTINRLRKGGIID